MRKLHYQTIAFVAIMLLGSNSSAFAQDKPNSDWITDTDPTSGKTIQIMELTLHPQPEPQPALKYRFLPDEFEMQEGNAAIYYLRAMGFLEQNGVQERLAELRRNARETAKITGQSIGDLPPYNWQSTAPSELPLEQVKEYLALLAFQPRDLAAAKKLSSFSLDRNIRDVENPTMLLLPEVQVMRELARNQSLRCRVAIAEGRFEDAFEIIGQQHALARHISNDPILVSNLVGIAIAGIAWTDTLYLLQMPNTPNLYWALAALPKPLVDLRKANAYERQFYFLQAKAMIEVDEHPRSVEYWRDFIDRVMPQLIPIAYEFDFNPNENMENNRIAFVSFISASYPGAKRYLLDVIGLEPTLVDSYPIAQVFFLAQKRFFERAQDEQHKWQFVDYSAAVANPEYQSREARFQQSVAYIGGATFPATAFLPMIPTVFVAEQRCVMQISLLQTLEAIRLYGATHANQLPKSLDELPLPAPQNPFTGNSFQYALDADGAVLTATDKAITYKLIIHFAKPNSN
jgi:hypothetical protein